MTRREFLASTAFAMAAGLATRSRADVPTLYDWNSVPPTDSRAAFIDWMVKNRGEDHRFLGERFDRFRGLIANRDVWEKRNMRAYLLTPREEFVTPDNLARAYEPEFLDIGYGVTITDSHDVARMTSAIDVKRGEKVLEIGTGSGYQSAYLSNLTDKVWSIEIIRPLFERTREVYDSLIARGYTEYRSITARNADGYYGWREEAPFDKIIVTCGIDHVPPPLLQQLKAGGLMVVPIGPPGAQHVLKLTKTVAASGAITVSRSDIYGGAIVNFVPFTKLVGDAISGRH